MSTNICSETFETSDNHFRCSRCQLTYYKDGDAQKRQWKIHKTECARLTTAQKKRIDAMSLKEAADYFGQTLFPTDVCHNDTVYLFQHIRKLMDEGAPDPTDVEMELHSVCRGSVIFNPSDAWIYKFYTRPGMTNYLLTDNTEDLLRSTARIIKSKLAKYNGRPTEEYIEAITDADEKVRVQQACKELDEAEDKEGYGSPSSYQFCYLYYNLIVGAAIHGNTSSSSIHDGLGRLRVGSRIPSSKGGTSTALAKAALTRAMQLWADPLVRSSCGDAMAPAASLALTAVKEKKFDNDDNDDSMGYQLIPGLTVDEAILACLGEMEECAGSQKYSVQLLKQILFLVDAVESYRHWTTMPLIRRARVARSAVSFLLQHGVQDTEGSYGETAVPATLLKDVIVVACETEDQDETSFAVVRRNVWTMCAQDEMLGPEPCGHNDECRAYFHFLLRLTAHDVERNLTAKDTIETWVATKFPRGKGKHSAVSLEKLACMKLVQDPAYHKDWCRMLGITVSPA